MDSKTLDQLADATRMILRALSPLEANILRKSFGIEAENSEYDIEIALSLGIPVEFVEEYRARALRKIRHPTHQKSLHEFFEHQETHRAHAKIAVP